MIFKSKLPSIEVPQAGIFEFLFSNEANTPDDKPMLYDAVDTSKFITYSQLKNDSLRFGAGLQDMCDFKDGDVVALFASSQYEYSIPYLGTMAANGILTTANPNFNIEELIYQFQLSSPKIVICQEDNIQTTLIAADRAGIKKTNIFIFGDKEVQGIQPFKTALMRDRKAIIRKMTLDEAKEKTAVICFSSGTTGKSKGVMTTHANMTSNLVQFASLDRKNFNKEIDRMLSVVPLFHMLGLNMILNAALYLGLPAYILSRFDPVLFCEVVQKNKITYMPCVPPICLFLAKDKIVDDYDLSSLRNIICGGSPLGVDIYNQAMRRLPNLFIKQAYGLTETSPFATVEPSENTVHASIGILLPNMSAKLVDEDGKEIQHGNQGELWLKGPNIMKGYLKNQEATLDSIDEDGYLHTGDIVVVDKNEHFYIVDRKKELIKYNGFQVAPAELEGILVTYPGVIDCAVIGIYNHELATELPRAYITLGEGLSPSPELATAIMKFVSDKVATYKQIRSVLFIDVIPRGPAGKILRRVLRDSCKDEDSNIKSKL